MPKSTCIARDCSAPAAGRGKYCAPHSPRRSRNLTLEQRIAARVPDLPPDQCWPWAGFVNARGYGVLRYGTKNVSAHRAYYQMIRGPIDPAMVIDHACHNTRCVNPDHLRPVTPKQNVENFGALRSSNTTGYRGVWLHSSGLYAAEAVHEGKVYRGGYFKTAAEAGAAAQRLRLDLHSHNDRDRVA